ncbi:MAG: hypothetical protein WAL91_06760 [Propionicimonas sp.]
MNSHAHQGCSGERADPVLVDALVAGHAAVFAVGAVGFVAAALVSWVLITPGDGIDAQSREAVLAASA